MALPVILINSATGSDSAASGAGPATALTGSAAATDGTGLVVTLDGSPDLTGVATDGSHVIYLADATVGNRNFGKITAKDNGAKTVTASNAFGTSLSALSWAIGGIRASIGGTNSAKLLTNNNLSGDAMPGWIVQLQSGHTETMAARLAFRRAGDTTDGSIILQSEPGAATLPILTFSHNGEGLYLISSFLKIRNVEIRNTNATKTASVAVQVVDSTRICISIENVKIEHATDRFWRGIYVGAQTSVIGCVIGNTASHAIFTASSGSGLFIANNRIFSTGAAAINLTSAFSGSIINNLIHSITGDGIAIASGNSFFVIANNTIDTCSSDGFELSTTTLAAGGFIMNNIITNISGYILNFSNVAITPVLADTRLFQMMHNTWHTASSGFCNLTLATTVAHNNTNIDPDYVGSGDYTPQEPTLEGTAFPVTLP